MSARMDSANHFSVVPAGNGSLRIMLAPEPGEMISRGQALNLAAWLVATVNETQPKEGTLEEFERLVSEIRA